VVVLDGELDTHAETVLAARLVERVEGVVTVVDLLRYRLDERLADAVVHPLF
jgi:osmotically-inducible protein OsmY